MPITGFLGDACINTYTGTNAATGSLTSPPFVIQRNYINLLVGGADAGERRGFHLIRTDISRQGNGWRRGPPRPAWSYRPL